MRWGLLIIMLLCLAVPANAGLFDFFKDPSITGMASDKKITICHFPPGNPENVQTISISKSAWPAHEAHGDLQGECAPGNGLPCVDEICDGIDNDCDGDVDEDITRECGDSNVGVCQFGYETCKKGSWSKCIESIDPDQEICDNIDNDCDGLVDEELEQVCGSDEGICTTGMQTCSAGAWRECSGIMPQDEACDGVDNNCDGEIDEGCDCQGGDIRTCGSDEGECSSGVQECVFGFWGDCKDEIGPKEEICDGLDNNCDGQVDEEITRECGDNYIGECSKGEQTCSNGEWGVCEGEILPDIEICDNIDNDCDGQTDESLTKQCEGTGSQQCVSGGWTGCENGAKSVRPILECVLGDTAYFGYLNENENNIEILVGGENKFTPEPIDRGQVVNFSPGRSSYYPNNAFSVEFENELVWTLEGPDGNVRTSTASNDSKSCELPCSDEDGDGYNDLICGGNDCDDSDGFVYVGAVEQCDGIDNNCDGSIDEGLIQECGIDTGVCEKGQTSCIEGEWSECVGEVGPVLETCDGMDNNCDGSIDEELSRECGSNVGECVAGFESCNNGAWSECVGGIIPIDESCDNLDNDCDGQTDEDCICTTGETKSCGSDVGECSVGVQTCINNAWNECDGIFESIEICDGLDNDCDGTIDEELVKQCGSTDIGLCQYGTQECSLGVWQDCQGNIEPVKETCKNKLDDDCDGKVDEGCSSSSKGGSGGGSYYRTTVAKPKQSDGKSGYIMEPSNTVTKTSVDKKIDIEIVNVPKIDINDQAFVIEAYVENIGDVVLGEIEVIPELPEHFESSPISVDGLEIGERKNIVLSVKNNLCYTDSFNGKDLDVKVTAKEKDVQDKVEFGIPLKIPDFSIAVLPFSDDEVNVCFFINNKEQDTRDKLEIEFEIYDQKGDQFIDFISPISARPGAVEIFTKTYNIQRYPFEQKVYNNRAYLYEGGTVFTEGYIQGRAKSQIDLTEFEAPEQSAFGKFIAKLFKRGD